MTIQFDCLCCKKTIQAPADNAGTYISCPLCQAFVPVPTSQGDINLVEGRSARTTPMASEWFYTRDGKNKSGPVSSAELQTLAKSGQFLPTDMVWKEGMAKWMAASTIKGLFPSDVEPVTAKKLSPAAITSLPIPAAPSLPVPVNSSLPNPTAEDLEEIVEIVPANEIVEIPEVVPAKQSDKQAEDQIDCPFCAERIKAKASNSRSYSLGSLGKAFTDDVAFLGIC